MRGHGQSEKPAQRLQDSAARPRSEGRARRARPERAAVAGHSMGSSVLWCYWDLFGAHRIASAIFIDQMPAITALPSWSDADRLTAGTIFDHVSLPTTIEALAGPQGVETTAGFVGGMFTPAYPAGPGRRGGRAQSADATGARGGPALQSRYPGLARHDPACRLEDARRRWHGQLRTRGSPRPGFINRSRARGWSCSAPTKVDSTSCSWKTRTSSTPWSRNFSAEPSTWQSSHPNLHRDRLTLIRHRPKIDFASWCSPRRR